MVKVRNIIASFQRIDNLISMQATGSPKELAKRLGISERQLYKYLSYLKEEMKAPIKYNKHWQSYYYERKGKLKIEWEEN